MSKEHSLRNRYYEIGIDGKSGRTIRLVNRLTGDDYLKSHDSGEMYKLYCLDLETGERVEVVPEGAASAKEEAAGDRSLLTLCFEGGRLAGAGGKSVKINASVRIETSDDDPESLWAIEISNQDERYEVVEALFPYFRGFYLGKTWEDDVIIYPHHAGERTLAPDRKSVV